METISKCLKERLPYICAYKRRSKILEALFVQILGDCSSHVLCDKFKNQTQRLELLSRVVHISHKMVEVTARRVSVSKFVLLYSMGHPIILNAKVLEMCFFEDFMSNCDIQ